MWDLRTLDRLNQEFEEKTQRDETKRNSLGESKFEDARELDTRNKD